MSERFILSGNMFLLVPDAGISESTSEDWDIVCRTVEVYATGATKVIDGSRCEVYATAPEAEPDEGSRHCSFYACLPGHAKRID